MNTGSGGRVRAVVGGFDARLVDLRVGVGDGRLTELDCLLLGKNALLVVKGCSGRYVGSVGLVLGVVVVAFVVVVDVAREVNLVCDSVVVSSAIVVVTVVEVVVVFFGGFFDGNCFFGPSFLPAGGRRPGFFTGVRFRTVAGCFGLFLLDVPGLRLVVRGVFGFEVVFLFRRCCWFLVPVRGVHLRTGVLLVGVFLEGVCIFGVREEILGFAVTTTSTTLLFGDSLLTRVLV